MIKKIHFETKWGWGLEKGDLGKLNSEVNKGTKCVTDKPFFFPLCLPSQYAFSCLAQFSTLSCFMFL